MTELAAPAPRPTRGQHKIYLGMAAGVGKTVRALGEIRDLRGEGVDAIIGLLETHGRKDTMAAALDLPSFPLLELDVQVILERRPDWVMVDELAHSNAPGSANPKRFMDIDALLSAGINVVSTLSVQHFESLNDEVARLTGVRVRERVPDRVVLNADEVVIVDITPESLRGRLSAGKIYAKDKVDQALQSFFTQKIWRCCANWHCVTPQMWSKKNPVTRSRCWGAASESGSSLQCAASNAMRN